MKTTILEKQHFIRRLLEHAVYGCHDKKPGRVIEKLSKEDRNICKELTSKDFNNRI